MAVEFVRVDATSVEARFAMGEYFAELDRRFTSGFDAAAALDDAAESLNPPTGLFVVARDGTAVVGCGAVQWLDDATAEIKRMWVDPGRRGIGLGRRLLAHLESQVADSGRRVVRLDTNSSLPEAVNMYRTLGYVDIDRYNDNPYAHHWFEKSLRPV